MFDIIRYTSERKSEWNTFLEQSKNGTFLMKRDYMDYHSDRFMDCSLMFYLNAKLYALMPANISGSTFYSHQGLTYGGLVMSEKCTTAEVLTLFHEMNSWLKALGVNKVLYKPVPAIYSNMPSEEDLYALFRCGAIQTTCGISTTIRYDQLMKWHKDRHTALNRAKRNHITVRKTRSIKAFWPILAENLQTRHGVSPVHTLQEMELLISRFPEEIVLYEAVDAAGECVGGMLAYQTTRVLHSQYLAASSQGKKCGSIEAIMETVLSENEFQYFDFGISTEKGGQYLNEGLIYQKEGFGGRGICYNTYEYTLS